VEYREKHGLVYRTKQLECEEGEDVQQALQFRTRLQRDRFC
jgi:hypothetical protein